MMWFSCGRGLCLWVLSETFMPCVRMCPHETTGFGLKSIQVPPTCPTQDWKRPHKPCRCIHLSSCPVCICQMFLHSSHFEVLSSRVVELGFSFGILPLLIFVSLYDHFGSYNECFTSHWSVLHIFLSVIVFSMVTLWHILCILCFTTLSLWMLFSEGGFYALVVFLFLVIFHYIVKNFVTLWLLLSCLLSLSLLYVTDSHFLNLDVSHFDLFCVSF